MKFDVRNEEEVKITEIIFHDKQDRVLNDALAYRLVSGSFSVRIEDEQGDILLIKDRLHAENMIKALDKAIDLGWLDK